MRNSLLVAACSTFLIITCVIVIRNDLLQIPQQRSLLHFLDRHLPALEKNKRRIVLLSPEEQFLPLVAGLDMVPLRLLPIPKRFAPIDYPALSNFQDIWLVTTKENPSRTFDGSLFTMEEKATSHRFKLTRLTLPGGLYFTDIAGNPGGGAYSYLCPDKSWVGGVTLTTLPEGITSVTPTCRDAKGHEKKERSFGDKKKGAATYLVCPANAPLTGITFYSDKTVRGLALLCPINSAIFDPAAIPIDGRTDLPATTRSCPNGSRLRGIYGSAGSLLDSVGLICGK